MRSILLALSLFLLPLAGRAETILVNGSEGGIYMVDVDTLAVREITSAPQFFDIAISPKGDILGVTAGGQLWKVDPSGAHLPLGSLPIFVNALVFDAAGGLVGAGHQKLVGISPTDGATRLLGAYPGFFSSGDMAFAPDGALYATGSPGPDDMDTLFIKRPGGGMQAIGPIGFKNVYGLAWSTRYRTLIGVTEDRELIVIDRKTGKGRLRGTLAIQGRGYGASGFGAGKAAISLLQR